jgi:hypothetical protein
MIFVVLLSAWGYGIATLKLIRLEVQLTIHERLGVGLALGLGLISLITLFFGYVGYLHRGVMLVVLLIPAFAELTINRQGYLQWMLSSRKQLSSITQVRIPIVEFIVVLVMLVFVWTMLLGAVLPETDFDVREYQRSQCLNLKKLLGDRVAAIDYAELHKSIFCSNMLQRLTGVEVILPEVRANVTSDKPFQSLFSADIRRLWTDLLQAPHPYHSEVDAAVSRTMNSLRFDFAEEERIHGALAAKLDSVVLEVMSQPEAKERLINIFNIN